MKNIFYKFAAIVTISASLFFAAGSNAAAQQNNNTNENREIFSQQDLSLSVYPVPAKTSVYVRLSQGLKSQVDRMEMVNVIGRKVMEQTIADKNTTEIVFNNLNSLPKGLYMVIARDKYGKILQSAKMVINGD
jgi:hypothetical protein